MKKSLQTPRNVDRRRAGWTAFAPLPSALVILLVAPVLYSLPSFESPVWADVDALLVQGAESARSLAYGLFDAVTDTQTLVRGITGRDGGSFGVE